MFDKKQGVDMDEMEAMNEAMKEFENGDKNGDGKISAEEAIKDGEQA